MLARIIAGVIARPVTTTMVTIALVVFGFVATTRLPVDLLPNLTYPSLTVQTSYTDAAPLEMEELVTRPIEELVGSVPGVIAIDSVSREGQSEVVLDFAWGTSIDSALAQVREKLDRVRLPPLSERPIVLRYDPSQEAVLRLALHLKPGQTGMEINDAEMRFVADRQVKRALEKIRGVAAVEIRGGDQEQILVEVDHERLSALGLTTGDVVDAVKRDHVNRPGGALTDQGSRFLIRTVHEAKEPKDLEGLVIRSNGQAHVRLRDVAKVYRAPLEREESFFVDGSQAIELGVFREGDANTVKVAGDVLSGLQNLTLPSGYEIKVLSNQATFIESAVEEVIANTLFGGVLAVLVLLFFLRKLRPTIVIAVAIPISLLIAFVPLTIFGVSLNLMSLGGLALGVGMLVDNSIVVLEAIARVRETEPELPAAKSAWKGTTQVASSVVSSTLTTIAVFFPMVFVEGIASQLVRDLSLAVSFSIASSMFVSLTLVPVLEANAGVIKGDSDAPPLSPVGRVLLLPLVVVARLLRLIGRALGLIASLVARLFAPLARLYDAVESLYAPALRATLRVPYLVLLAAVLVCTLVVGTWQTLGQSLLPDVHQGEFFVQVLMPPGTSLERSETTANRLSQAIAGDARVDHVFVRNGSVSQAASASGNLKGTHLAQINISMRDDPAQSWWQELKGKWLHDRPSVEERRFEREEQLFAKIQAAQADQDVQLRRGRPALFALAAPVAVEVYSEDLTATRDYVAQLVEELKQQPLVSEVISDDTVGRPEVQVDFDRNRLARLGIGVDAAALAVQRAIQGEAAGILHTSDEQLTIRVQLPRVDRRRIADVKRVIVGNSGGKPISLEMVAEVQAARGPAEIRRIDGRRGLRITAQGELSELDALARAVKAVIAEHPPATQGRYPLTAELAGQASEVSESIRSLAFAIAIALFLVYVVMASTFESLHHPLLIMLTVPLASTGVVLVCWLAGIPLSIMVGMGMIILGGVVVNNAIVLISAVNDLRREGLETTDALVKAGSMRIRPILMTTATTVLGLLPMALGIGDGAALRQPLALSILGGLSVATLLTLFVIPAAYRMFPGKRPTDTFADGEDEELPSRM